MLSSTGRAGSESQPLDLNHATTTRENFGPLAPLLYPPTAVQAVEVPVEPGGYDLSPAAAVDTPAPGSEPRTHTASTQQGKSPGRAAAQRDGPEPSVGVVATSSHSTPARTIGTTDSATEADVQVDVMVSAPAAKKSTGSSRPPPPSP